jgi:ornithine cyclodeaminase/alanine dehydrogenase-like protein (mu-crystallin family)
MDDLIETMATALRGFSAGDVVQPVRTVIAVDGDRAFCALMPAFVPPLRPSSVPPPPHVDAASERGRTGDGAGTEPGRRPAALGTKLVTVFEGNHARGLPSHLASILLLDPETGALRALLDGRYITEARTAAVSAVSSRLLGRPRASSLAIIGSGVQARSHLEALSRVHTLRSVAVWSPTKEHRDRFVAEASSAATSVQAPAVRAVDHPGEAVVGADIIVLVTSSPAPVIESGWVKPGTHVISVGACRPTQREMDPALVARGRLFVDSRAAALVESGDVVMGIQEGRFTATHIAAELGELIAGAPGRQNDMEITIFKSLGLAVEDVTAANLAYRRAMERGIGLRLEF